LYTYIDQMREQAKRQFHTYLAAIAERLTTCDGAVPNLTVTTSAAINVDVAETLAQVAQQELVFSHLLVRF